MVVGTLLIGGVTGILACLGYVQSSAHRRNLRRIPIRIHVNGTRGKSSVARLIAAGLRAGGIRTFAKTTGTLPRMILPDGSERAVVRLSNPNVIEQVAVVQSAVEQQAEAIVMECMALQPALQSLSELTLVRSTHGVITNARPDHLDVMGPTPYHVARALAGTVPVRGKLFTAERARLDVFAQAARDRESEMFSVGELEMEKLAASDLQRFPYIEHPENVALALAVCEDLGIERQTALAGMWSANPDVGVMTKHELSTGCGQITFVNGFAANDPESTEQIWNLAMTQTPGKHQRIAVVNCRLDRPDRSRQLAESIATWTSIDQVLLVGSGTSLFARRALSLGFESSKISLAEKWSADSIFRRIENLAGRSAIAVGIGNIGGVGLELERYVQQQSGTQLRILTEAA